MLDRLHSDESGAVGWWTKIPDRHALFNSVQTSFQAILQHLFMLEFIGGGRFEFILRHLYCVSAFVGLNFCTVGLFLDWLFNLDFESRRWLGR